LIFLAQQVQRLLRRKKVLLSPLKGLITATATMLWFITERMLRAEVLLPFMLIIQEYLYLPVKRLKRAKLLQRAVQQAIQQVLTVILRFDLTVHV
jgi:Membrane proteins related to metalloendopeptidases